MLTTEKTVKDRKAVVKRLEELTGCKSEYSGAPSLEYRIGAYKVLKKGIVQTIDTEAHRKVFKMMAAEGLVKDVPEKDDKEPEPVNEQVKVSIALPFAGHDNLSVRNLMSLIYQKGSLINKSTGGHFEVKTELIELLSAEPYGSVYTAENVVAAHPEYLQGIELKDEKVIFTGFPEYTNSETLKVWMQFASLMNRQARSKMVIHVKPSCEENEKFIFRTWLNRLGMIGPEYKTARRVLLKNLTGSSAFRHPELIDRRKK